MSLQIKTAARQIGFTLIELISVIIVVSVVMLGVTSFLSKTKK